MIIRAWRDDAGTYLVQIEKSLYEMSTDANMPNGVNMYVGEDDNWPKRPPTVDRLPIGVVKAIALRVWFDGRRSHSE